jgi:hypothetical protein
MAPLLTIGMAVYDDFDGPFFTLHSLALHNDLSDVELILVDNLPGSKKSRRLRNLIEGGLQQGTAGGRYIAAGEITGTAAPRNRVFQEARGKFVLNMDSHVLLQAGAINKLKSYYLHHPDTRDILTGPLLYDDRVATSTHFADVWRDEMWGIWGSAWMGPRGEIFQVIEERGRARFFTLEMNHLSVEIKGISEPGWSQHEKILEAQGCRRLGSLDGDEFEIPGQGLGLFTCAREAWMDFPIPGFNPNFREFGGEELYIHEKFRQRGDKALCLGFLKWLHRFADEEEPPTYPRSHWHKARNNIIGHLELGRSLEPIFREFVVTGKVPAIEWEQLIKHPDALLPPQNVIDMANGVRPYETLEQIYDVVRYRQRDLNEHIPHLRHLSKDCQHITEFSKRCESLPIWTQAAHVVSHNVEANDRLVQTALRLHPDLTLDNRTSQDFQAIDPTDFLFIDSTHTYANLKRELEAFAPSVRRYIVIHDTQLYGMGGEDGGPGMLFAIREFVESPDTPWFIVSHTDQQYGLTVLSRDERDRPPSPVRLWPANAGPGTEMKKILGSLGVNPSPTCDCNAFAVRMDEWGVEGCREHFDEIVEQLQKHHGRWGWAAHIKAAALAVKTGLAFKLDPLNPFPSLVREAINRAEFNQRNEAA